MSANELTVPESFTTEVLKDHVNEIIFDSGARLEMDCVLCLRAAAAGLWNDWYDVNIPEEAAELAELKRRAALL